MKTSLIICLLALTLLVPAVAVAVPRSNPEETTIVADSDVKVYYSFDHYANNSKVQRTYVSGDMLKAASGTKMFQSTAWDISNVITRLTGLLSLHTHSRSTTKLMRKDLDNILQKKAYERLLQTKQNDVEYVVFCHRKGSKDKMDELIVFKFRSDYCCRIIQLTGNLRTSDIASIMKMGK